MRSFSRANTADNNQISTPDMLGATPEVIMGITITITDIIREAEVGPAVWMAIATSGREWLWLLSLLYFG